LQYIYWDRDQEFSLRAWVSIFTEQNIQKIMFALTVLKGISLTAKVNFQQINIVQNAK
jgi:hypothetical protein